MHRVTPPSRTSARALAGLAVCAALIGLLAKPSAASLEFDATASLSGQGLGAVLTVLTVQNTPSESGCVAWNGSADVIGSSACPGGSGIAGGDEKTGGSQTLTRTIGAAALTTCADLRIIFNGTENDNQITVDDLRLTIFNAAGTVLFTSGPLTGKPIFFADLAGGVGSSGKVFKLDAAQITAADAANACSVNTNRVGLASSLSGSSSGNETFALAKFTAVTQEEADLGVTKTAPSVVSPGATFTYHVTVTNFGPQPDTGVTLVDTLPAGVTLVSATPSQGTPCVQAPVGTITCALGALAVNASATVDITVTVTAPGGTTLVNTAVVSGDVPDTSNTLNNTATATTQVLAPIPTLSDWGMIGMAALLAGLGAWTICRRRTDGGIGGHSA